MSLLRLLLFVSLFLSPFLFSWSLFLILAAYMSKYPIQTSMGLRTTKEKLCTCISMIEEVVSSFAAEAHNLVI